MENIKNLCKITKIFCNNLKEIYKMLNMKTVKNESKVLFLDKIDIFYYNNQRKLVTEN